MKLAPIVLFTYNRPWHTRQTIEALQKNELAQYSEIFIYSDAPKNEQAVKKVSEVRNYIKTINGFKKISLIERKENVGLARNIIDGVTDVVNKYGRVIVIEDDVVVNLNFLIFMNNALDFYENTKKVWHISGWNYPIDMSDLPETFLWRLMNCKGWATWEDRWKYFERNPEKLKPEFSKEDIHHFNLEGTHDFWKQVQQNVDGKINTWAIFWYAIIFKQKGLCLNPGQSLVQDIGFDGSGIHCNKCCYSETMQPNHLPVKFQNDLIECKKCIEIIKNYLNDVKLSSHVQIIRKIKQWFNN